MDTSGIRPLAWRQAGDELASAARYGKPLDMDTVRRRVAFMESDAWEPCYSRWRHGGSYVDSVIYPGGAIGCIGSAATSASGTFAPVCFELGQFRTRDAAARAERAFAVEVGRAVLAMAEAHS